MVIPIAQPDIWVAYKNDGVYHEFNVHTDVFDTNDVIYERPERLES